mgnify:CR=1 FL=1
MAFRTQPAIPVLTNGTYPATITSLDVQASQYPKGKDRLKWTFTLTTPTHEYEILAWTNTLFHVGSPEHTWAGAALGRTLGDDDPLEEQDLLGQPVQLKITPRAGKTEGTILYNVDAVLPARSSEDSEAGMLGTAIDTEDDVPFDKF